MTIHLKKINSFGTGGGSPIPPSPEQGEYFVKVIDYDGEVIDEKWLNDGDEYTLPANPNRTSDGLVFQEWSCTQDIVNGKVTINKSNVMIGAVYTTVSGQSEFDIEVNNIVGMKFFLKMNGTKDWGDGTINEVNNHTYSSPGKYTVKCNGNKFSSSNNDGIFGQTTYSSSVYNMQVKNIRLTNVNEFVNGSYLFYYCYALETITISNTVNNLGTGSNIFSYNSCLKALVIPSSVTIAFGGNFASGSGIKHVVIPKSNNISFSGTSSFASCFNLEEFVFPKTSSTSFPERTLQACSQIKSISFPDNIESLGGSYMFYQLYNLDKVRVPSSLVSITGDFFNQCTNIREFDFSNSSQVVSLGSISYITAISNMIFPGVKIKVPFSLYNEWKNTINWVYFEPNITSGEAATINFLGDGMSSIYVNKELITGTTTTWIGNTMPYVCYNDTNKTVVSSTKTGITEGENININISFANAKKITLSVGTSGLDVKFIIGNVYFNAIEDNGNYFINVSGIGTEVKYIVNGGNAYMDEEGTITTTGEDLTQPITLVSATTSSWTRPDLTENGTLGGDSFAVLDEIDSNSYAWKAVDSNMSSSGTTWSCRPKLLKPKYIFYNPTAINVTSIASLFYNASTNYSFKNTPCDVFGSNDGISWKKITSSVSGSGTKIITLTNNNFYKYYKMIFETYNSDYGIRVANFTITANEKTSL